ncbi:MAG: hypothetical protein IIC73_00705, partial [Armatimonadetes bacterium]|nr:hypothetical protein [Armatimonadota bacterium]
MKLNRLALTLPTALAAAFCLAQPMPYASSRTTIRAGVLLIESQRVGLLPGVPANVAPHIWSNLDQDVGAKPASWTFDNPLGQTTMTFDMRQRWLATPGAGPLPAVGTKLSKSDAAYWEISLANSPNEVLAAFDVLSLTVNGTLSLNSIEREKLRRFIDQGGVLWIDLVNDNLGATPIVLDLANGMPYGFDWLVSGLPVEANLNHPIMRSPNPIRLSDLRRMDYRFAVGPILTRPIDLTLLLPVSGLLTWVSPDSRRLQPVAGNLDGRTVSAAQLGEGYLVVTSRGVTATLNLGFDPAQPPPRIPQPNRAFRGLAPVFDEASGSAAKFAVNVISLATSYSTAGGGSRHSSGSAVTVGAPLGRRFTTNVGGALFEVNKPAVLFKGFLITTVGGRVTVYDANPSRDIDGDGDPDDGFPDALGSGADLIWQSVVVKAGRLSAPTVVEAPDSTITNPVTGLIATDLIWVVDARSNVLIYDLNNPGTVTALPLTEVRAPGGPPADDPSAPYAPTVHEGVVVIADSQASDTLGRVWIIYLNSGELVITSSEWAIHSVSAMTPAGASPTVGYIPIQDNSTGLDRVVYVAHQPTTIGSPRPASLTSLWLGARGEQPVRVALTSPTNVRITTRASLQGLPVLFESPLGLYPSLGIKVTILKSNGDPFTLAEMRTVFTGGISDPGTRGEINVQLKDSAAGLFDWDGTATPDPGDDVGWRIDYTIDWGQAKAFGGVPAQSYIRGSLQFPDTVANTRRIIGGAALGPSGNLFIATASPGLVGTGSTLFNLREEGRGEFRLVYRYDLYDDLTYTVNQGAGVTDTRRLKATFVDEDELLTDLTFLDVPITSLRFVGGPAVRGDTVYCVAAGLKNGFIDTSVLMAFHAN